MQKKKTLLIGIAVLVLVAALMAGIYVATRPETQEGSKTIVVEVVHKDGSAQEFTYHTDAEYLGDVLLAEGLVEGEEGEFGLFLTAVDGETADFAMDGGWWCLMKDGEMTGTGVSETPIADGDRFQLVYTVG